MHLYKVLHVLLATIAAFIGFTALTSSMPTSDTNTLAHTVAAKPSTDHAAYPHAGAVLALPLLEHNTTAGPLIRREQFVGQSANMDFHGFAGGNCDGTHFFFSADYGSYYTFQPPINSMILSRNMDQNEELDFAGESAGNLCGGTNYQTAPSVVGPIYGGRCYGLPTVTCMFFVRY